MLLFFSSTSANEIIDLCLYYIYMRLLSRFMAQLMKRKTSKSKFEEWERRPNSIRDGYKYFSINALFDIIQNDTLNNYIALQHSIFLPFFRCHFFIASAKLNKQLSSLLLEKQKHVKMSVNFLFISSFLFHFFLSSFHVFFLLVHHFMHSLGNAWIATIAEKVPTRKKIREMKRCHPKVTIRCIFHFWFSRSIAVAHNLFRRLCYRFANDECIWRWRRRTRNMCTLNETISFASHRHKNSRLQEEKNFALLCVAA